MGDYDFDLGGIDDALAEGKGVGNFDVGTLLPVQSEWSSMASGGGKGFWGDLFSKFGGGVKDTLVGAGDLAKSALPIAGIGTSIMGALASRDAANALAQQAKTASRGQSAQLEASKKAQDVAPKVEPFADKTAAVGEKIEGMAPEFTSVAKDIGAVAPKQDAVASRLQGLADPLTKFGTSSLESASRGEIAPAEQAEIDQWVKATKAQIQDYFGRAGLGDSTMLKESLAEIDAKALAMKGGRLDSERELGITAQQAGGAITGAESDVYGAEGATFGRQADALRGGVDTLRGAASTYGGAANILGTEGNILTGAGATAGSAAQTAQQEEAALANLIAAAQAQIAKLTAGSS